jgi:pectinesterase
MFFSKLALTTLGFAGLSLGAPAPSNTLEKRTARTSAPSGCLSVKAGTTTSGWYKTVTLAVASLSGTAAACIFVYSGTYNEQFVVQYGGALTSMYTTSRYMYTPQEIRI